MRRILMRGSFALSERKTGILPVMDDGLPSQAESPLSNQ